MDQARIIGEVFRETGVSIDAGDPVLVCAAANRLALEEAGDKIAERAATQITPALYRAATVAAAVKIRSLGLTFGTVLLCVAAAGLGVGYWWGAHRSDTAVLAIACSRGVILETGGVRYCALRAP